MVEPQKYRFDDEAYEEFVAWMKDKEVPWQSEAELRWQEFKKAAEKERWKDSMDSQMAEIDQNFSKSTEENLRIYKQEISEIIEDHLVARYCYSEGRIFHNLPLDTELAKAIEILQDTERYNHIVTSQDTERK